MVQSELTLQNISNIVSHS
ncbi:unnamed protein product [Oikopleura dioica]|uniref:Uncharacterized protein n=1 Tax=Oikopleura dioica TaxID=34765 RepID=E4XRX9_OIKDI|nr:unnamed protein product [Oikopleura dioica]